jgi:hypothetical protein
VLVYLFMFQAVEDRAQNPPWVWVSVNCAELKVKAPLGEEKTPFIEIAKWNRNRVLLLLLLAIRNTTKIQYPKKPVTSI